MLYNQSEFYNLYRYVLIYVHMHKLELTGCTLDVVRYIYMDLTTRVKVGKAHTDVVMCRRGVKQGCPLSPILFDLAMEQLVPGLETG